MSFATGSSCFSHSPLHYSEFVSSSSSSQSALLCSRNTAVAAKRKRKVAAVACCFRPEERIHGVFANRRTVLFLGISVLPILQLRAGAIEGSDTDNSELKKLEQDPQIELPVIQDSAHNVSLSLLNAFGIFGTGVFGALYALTQKENKAADEKIESMKNRLEVKEAAFVSAEKDFEKRLQDEQEEREKQLKKAKDEQMSLLKQLDSADSTVAGLRREINNEKRFCEGLRVQVESLQSCLSRAEDAKMAVEKHLQEKLDSVEVMKERINLLGLELKDKEEHVGIISESLAGKDLELKNLNSVYDQRRREVDEAKNEIEQLRDEIGKNQKELELKNSKLDELDARIRSLMAEREDFKTKFGDLSRHYNNLKLNSEKQAASDAKLVEEKDHAINELKERLDRLADEASENRETIAYLTNEREDLKRISVAESENVKSLQQELKITHEHLITSRNECSDLDKLLQTSRNLCSEFETEIFELRAELVETNKRHQTSLDTERRKNEHLKNELAEANELLVKTTSERDTAVRELEDSARKINALQKELVVVYKKAETTMKDLEEEKKKVLCLNKELQALEIQMSKDNETRKSIEADLEDAVKSLDIMNRNAFVISGELETANSRVLSLENETETLIKSMSEQTNVTREAQENLEDAHILVMKLGKERERLDRKAKKLEEELASAKGEILRMRSRVNSSKEALNDDDQRMHTNGTRGNATVKAKRDSRKRKTDKNSS